MKIFNWVHRRFVNKEGLTESGKKSCVIDGGGDNNALKVFDGWKQGILTIGTLGYDPLKQKDECFADDEAENIESDAEISSDSKEEETNPLVYANNCECECEEYLEMKRDNICDGDTNAMIKKERITLAELFSADTEKLQITMAIIEKGHDQVMKKQDYKYSKSGRRSSFANNTKLTDARPIHKLHRMMMMMKRKIHPDEGLNSAKIGDINITTETALLLPSQDAII